MTQDWLIPIGWFVIGVWISSLTHEIGPYLKDRRAGVPHRLPWAGLASNVGNVLLGVMLILFIHHLDRWWTVGIALIALLLTIGSFIGRLRQGML